VLPDSADIEAAMNIDRQTVEGFGEEWTTYDQSGTDAHELELLFDSYFRPFPWHELPNDAIGFDAGCGSGRWAKFVAPRVGRLLCIDASGAALAVARRNLSEHSNCMFVQAGLNDMPIPDASMDFGYSLGVLHHLPDTAAGLTACVAKLKPGAPFLVYVYYALENRPIWFRAAWWGTDWVRRGVCRLPHAAKLAVTRLIAAAVYWPLARSARLAESAGINVSAIPLASYRRRSFYTMQTDALDRFGTRLEQRFTAAELRSMMERAGLVDIAFGEEDIYWCAVGRRAC
jgi:SAM-dependent methyltransferase